MEVDKKILDYSLTPKSNSNFDRISYNSDNFSNKNINFFCVCSNEPKSQDSKDYSSNIIYPENKGMKNWTKVEDKLLLETAKYFQYKRWKKISNNLPGRSSTQCCARFKRIRPGIVKGSWIKDEDENLKKLVDEHGKNWTLISKYMLTRTGKQIRDRYLNSLDPSVLKKKFTLEEDKKIIELYKKFGTSWSFISKRFIGRTGDMIKNRFYSSLRRIMSSKNSPSNNNSYSDGRVENMLDEKENEKNNIIDNSNNFINNEIKLAVDDETPLNINEINPNSKSKFFNVTKKKENHKRIFFVAIDDKNRSSKEKEKNKFAKLDNQNNKNLMYLNNKKIESFSFRKNSYSNLEERESSNKRILFVSEIDNKYKKNKDNYNQNIIDSNKNLLDEDSGQENILLKDINKNKNINVNNQFNLIKNKFENEKILKSNSQFEFSKKISSLKEDLKNTQDNAERESLNSCNLKFEEISKSMNLFNNFQLDNSTLRNNDSLNNKSSSFYSNNLNSNFNKITDVSNKILLINKNSNDNINLINECDNPENALKQPNNINTQSIYLHTIINLINLSLAIQNMNIINNNYNQSNISENLLDCQINILINSLLQTNYSRASNCKDELNNQIVILQQLLNFTYLKLSLYNQNKENIDQNNIN